MRLEVELSIGSSLSLSSFIITWKPSILLTVLVADRGSNQFWQKVNLEEDQTIVYSQVTIC